MVGYLIGGAYWMPPSLGDRLNAGRDLSGVLGQPGALSRSGNHWHGGVLAADNG